MEALPHRIGPRTPGVGPALLAAAALAFAGCATLPSSSGWIEVRSRNFAVVSDLPEADALELVDELERFRAAVELFTNAKLERSEPPVAVYAFASSRSYEPFRDSRDEVGSFVPRMRGSLMWLRHSRGDSLETLLHEYTHSLVLEGSEHGYPRWFNEGFAEYMGATRAEDGAVWIGGYPSSLSAFGRAPWLYIGAVLSPDRYESWSRDTRAMFYLESWLLVRYLMHGQEEGLRFGPRMKKYLLLLEAGHSEEIAFPEAFGANVAELDRRLQRYLEEGTVKRIGVPLDKLSYLKKREVRSLGPGESAERLGDLALSIGSDELALRLFQTAVGHPPPSARALCGLGRALERAGRSGEALRFLEQALEMAPEDALIQLDYGDFFLSLARATEEPETRRADLAVARQHLVRSRELDPGLVEAYAAYGASFLLPGENPADGLESIALAYSMMPSNPDLMLLLGRVYLATDRLQAAQEVLGRARIWDHGDQASEAAALLAQLDDAGPRSADADPDWPQRSQLP